MNRSALLLATVTVAFATIDIVKADENALPFGGLDSVKYAERLWKALNRARMVGPKAIFSKPYRGIHPHGAILDTIESKVKVGLIGEAGLAIVKRNYDGEGVSESAVSGDPTKWLEAIAVMYKRESGYDEENQDWFWAVYKPDGSLEQNDKGMPLAGRVAKGERKGCIACHSDAPGGDYRFAN